MQPVATPGLEDKLGIHGVLRRKQFIPPLRSLVRPAMSGCNGHETSFVLQRMFNASGKLARGADVSRDKRAGSTTMSLGTGRTAACRSRLPTCLAREAPLPWQAWRAASEGTQCFSSGLRNKEASGSRKETLRNSLRYAISRRNADFSTAQFAQSV